MALQVDAHAHAGRSFRRAGDSVKRLCLLDGYSRSGVLHVDPPAQKQWHAGFQHGFKTREGFREDKSFELASHILQIQDGPAIALARGASSARQKETSTPMNDVFAVAAAFHSGKLNGTEFLQRSRLEYSSSGCPGNVETEGGKFVSPAVQYSCRALPAS